MIRHIQPAQPAIRRTGGFTLVELMITISIIAILAGISLLALVAARGMARIDATRTTVEKISAIIMERYESYHTRRVPVNQDDLKQIAEYRLDWDASTAFTPTWGAQTRLHALRDLIRMEMPDRWSDVFVLDQSLVASFASIPLSSTDWRPNVILPPISPPNPDPDPTPDLTPALTINYFRKCQAAWTYMKSKTPIPDDDTCMTNLENYASAECLYMIVMSDPEAAAQFRSDEIGDTDDDGLPEFLDGWRRPIYFIRWPAGFVPEAQEVGSWATIVQYHGDSDLQTADPVSHHDPFDPQRVDSPTNPSDVSSTGYALYPLIYSAGPDGKYNIYLGAYDDGGVPKVHAYSDLIDPGYTGIGIDPYFGFEDDPAVGPCRIGRPFDSDNPSDPFVTLNHYDNIHNHRIEGR